MLLHTPAIQAAWAFAQLAHAGQKYGDDDYDVHVREVALTLQDHGYSQESWIIKGLLHDCFEDNSNVTLEILVAGFGADVAEGVDTCSGFGETRLERVTMIAEKMRQRPRHIPVKVADRIVNLRAAAKNKSVRHALLYLGEAAGFDEIVRDHVGDTMWLDLQDAYAACERMVGEHH
ncbi:hypothetical protein CcrC1_gp286 [Caulobacter phage C1]|nr:hypothetical protein CcrC1_gp286 [Caulobacter phage C1]UTU08515.1 HD/PDEase domain protein [Caulobacter phage C2]UTU10148.1 HD/PDEase domain protein [Caulobacter phage RB23]WGN97182.1 HD/PDEase domain protein [Bertelyvirus sp.]WGN97700.1 hypothetical protein [Bertelyvirus sp.]